MKRRVFALLLTLSLALSLVTPALAAESAATIRLSKTSGTVSVSKSSGKSLTLMNNMRLYNGYHVTTKAWINLDDTKLVKEDVSSEIEVRKSGKNLEVNICSGNVFFNVSEKLEEDESLNISTSTMIVGIRGTAGSALVNLLDHANHPPGGQYALHGDGPGDGPDEGADHLRRPDRHLRGPSPGAGGGEVRDHKGVRASECGRDSRLRPDRRGPGPGPL